MQITNIHEAKTHLSKLVERVLAGEDIVIAKAGKPMVRLVPYAGTMEKKPRQPGCWRGQVWMAEDFDETPQEIIDAFEGKEDQW